MAKTLPVNQMIPKNVKFLRKTSLNMAFRSLMGVNLTQQEFYTILSSSELLAKMFELGADEDRDKSLIFVVSVLAWIITGNLSNKLFGVELTGFVAGCFIVFFGNNIVGAFRLGVEQAILETISVLGNEEIKTRTERLKEIEERHGANTEEADRLEQQDDESKRDYWIAYTKFRRTTFQYVGLANMVNWVFIVSIFWTVFLGCKAFLDVL